MARSFREWIVWQKAMDLVVEVYRLSNAFPKHQQFALTSQLTRACVSVPANITEGNARHTRKDYAHFISIARGSLAETETLLLIAQRLGYVSEPDGLQVQTAIATPGRMLTSLHQKLGQAPLLIPNP